MRIFNLHCIKQEMKKTLLKFSLVSALVFTIKFHKRSIPFIFLTNEVKRDLLNMNLQYVMSCKVVRLRKQMRV